VADCLANAGRGELTGFFKGLGTCFLAADDDGALPSDSRLFGFNLRLFLYSARDICRNQYHRKI